MLATALDYKVLATALAVRSSSVRFINLIASTYTPPDAAAFATAMPAALKRNKSIQERLAEWDETLEKNEPQPTSQPPPPPISPLPPGVLPPRKPVKNQLSRRASVVMPEHARSGENHPMEVPESKVKAEKPDVSPALKAVVAPISGMLAGALEISTLWPTEWAKTQQQLHKADPNFSVIRLAKDQGLGIYRGLPPMLIGAPLQCAVRFSTLDTFVRVLTPAPPPGETAKPPGRGTMLVAGMMAGAFEAAIIVTPMETIKTRLVDANKGLIAGVKQFVEEEGIAGVYRGLNATVLKSASNQALRFFFFNEYKRIVLSQQAPKEPGAKPPTALTPLQALIGGMVAGSLGALGNTPFDVLKTRMQGLEAAQYTSTLDCLVKVVKQEGPLALYKGLGARCARVVPGQGIIFGAYEYISGGVSKLLGVH